MSSSDFIRAACAALVLGVSVEAAAQVVLPVPVPEPTGGTPFTMFVRGQPIGTEQISVTRSADGWTIVSSGRLAPPVDVVGRRVQVRYTPEWRPVDFSFDGTVRGHPQSVRTTVEGTSVRSDITVSGQTTQKSDTIAPDALLLLTNSFAGPYEALAARLRTATPGATIPAYGVPQLVFTIRVGETADDRIQTTGGLVSTRRTHLTFVLPGGTAEGDIWTDENGRLVRLSIPSQSAEVVREDIAAVSSRSVPISRPNDEQLKIPANGFILAGTLSRPTQSTASRLPAVVLVGGTGPSDRDEMVFGIPILGQIANALADAGFIVVRYDKRGIGQSGGRAESASLNDFADDVRAVVKMLSDRKDVDPKRIAVIGHSEGGAVALIAGAKEKKIAAIALIAANGVPGAELILAQQQHLLNKSQLSAEEKQAKIDLQKRIHEAVITGKGWDQLPADVRRQVDNPEFQSILTNDPAKVMPDVRQPILIVQGELDTQVAPANADRLEELARQRKKAPPVDVVKIAGVNHLLVPAKTGEVDEYKSLPDRQVSAKVIDALVTWLNKTLSAAH
jgi:pimeloyl-ACP methyl ester carboxylesterase